MTLSPLFSFILHKWGIHQHSLKMNSFHKHIEIYSLLSSVLGGAGISYFDPFLTFCTPTPQRSTSLFSIIINDVKHLFMYLFFMPISSLNLLPIFNYIVAVPITIRQTNILSKF